MPQISRVTLEEAYIKRSNKINNMRTKLLGQSKIIVKDGKHQLVKNDEGIPSRNQQSLASFSEYCLDHPEQRFFQALRNWFGVGFIYADNHDTFYWEEGVDYQIKK